jgi:hypothetical protein
MFKKSTHNVKGHFLGCIVNKLERSFRSSDYHFHYYNYCQNYSARYQCSRDEALDLSSLGHVVSGNGPSTEAQGDSMRIKKALDGENKEGLKDNADSPPQKENK